MVFSFLAYPVQTFETAITSELFSSIIPQKITVIASNFTGSGSYPQYTDSNLGEWQYFPADTWTTGFFPSMLYAMNKRSTICQGNGLNGTNWLEEARRWSTDELPLETTNTLGHDVGFVSFPFQDELELWVPHNECCSIQILNESNKEIQKIRRQLMQ